jgi:dipeptidyl aminopeptidase/acylaminoacyl peptidase
VVFIGGLMSDFGGNTTTGGDVYVLSLQDGALTDLTPAMSASASDLRWDCRGRLLVKLLADDATRVVRFEHLRPEPKGPTVLWSGHETLEGWSHAGSLACPQERQVIAHETFQQPPEIELGPIGHWHDLTHENAGRSLAADVHSIHWNNDGFHEQGWLLLPPAGAVTPDTRLPLITIVHGGPASAHTPLFSGAGLVSSLLARGWAVFLPNPRGSFGQGERYTRANVRDLGHGDLADILAGIDAAEAAVPIDNGRLGITGGSYGGFMTMWAITQTRRFRAGVANAGISDWLSYYGENGIDEWMIPYFGASVYDDPAVYARSSPINFIRAAHTPTFAYVGERDIECPASQSEEFWRALKTLHVPTSIMIYPGEGHGLRDPAHVADALARTLAWFDRYLGEGS